MDSTIPDEKELALREEKADLRQQMLPIIAVLSKLDAARNKWIGKLMELRAHYAIADRELAMATKLTKVDKKAKQADGTAALTNLLKDPEKARKLMAMLEGMNLEKDN